MVTLPCSLYYNIKFDGFSCFTLVVTVLLTIFVLPFYLITLIFSLFIEFFHLLVWLLSCCYCCKKKGCKCRNIKVDGKVQDEEKYKPPYNHQKIMMKKYNISILQFFLKIFFFKIFYFQHQRVLFEES